jgi:hypothetical protein
MFVRSDSAGVGKRGWQTQLANAIGKKSAWQKHWQKAMNP